MLQVFTNYRGLSAGHRRILLLLLFMLATWQSFAQVQVRGNVKDDTGGVLPGVNVIVKGSTTGTTTDSDGNFAISAASNDVLVFSFIGYKASEVTVGNQTFIDVRLEVDVQSLEEVVVVGYGVQKKSDLTGAVSLADPTEMTKQASSDVSQMLQGRVAGVSITSDGQPGASPSVRVRGVSTFGIGSGAEPLYVIDGYPSPGGIRDINPNDIETIQVLKDATAGAIYGNRAANGVVIVTTKGGKRDQAPTLGFNAYYGFQRIPQRLPLLNREGYQMMMNEAMENAGQPYLPGNDPTSPDYIDDIDTDWQDEGYKDGSIQNYNFNLSGGSANSTYFLSMDYLDNVGTLVGTGPDYKRYSFRVNSETKRGRLTIGENVYVMRSDENPLFYTTTISLPGNRPSLVNDLVQAAPTIPLYDPNRKGGYGGADQTIHSSISLNVPGFNTLVENSSVVNRILANVYGEVELFKNLSYRLNLSYDKTNITDELFVPKYDLGYFFPGPTAQYQVGTRDASSSLIENTLRYKVQLDKHNLEVLAGQSFQKFDFRQIRTFGSGLEEPYIQSLGSAANVSATDYQAPVALASFFGRINYAYDDRYLLTFNIRRDGSSRFQEDNRFEIFPSIGAAWKIQNDFQMPEFISELKLRGGYGKLGNQEIGNFRYQSRINRAIPYQFGPDIVTDRIYGAAITVLVDPNIQWEVRTTRSVGIDAVLFDGGLEFTAEYYSNTSDDVLMDLPIPNVNGSLAGLTTNVGSIQNSGIELSARFRKQMGDFSLDISPNFYTVKNEVLDLGPLAQIQSGGARTVVGRAIGEHYGFVYDGIFQEEDGINTVAPSDVAYDPGKAPFHTPQTSPGDVRYKDLNGDGQITQEGDRTFLGQAMPTYYYGINIVMNYKNFDFTVFGSGSGGNWINSNIYRGLMSSEAFGFTNRHEDILDRWTTDNPNTDIPRVVFQEGGFNNNDSDRPGWLQKGDYFRINTISLGYNIRAELLSKIKIRSARVYASMQNVHTFTSYKGYNPDFQSTTPIPGQSGAFAPGIINPGFDYGTFPRPQTTMFGVQLKF
jgi:TonB-dependent starch-binding outer membrane protein SusC